MRTCLQTVQARALRSGERASRRTPDMASGLASVTSGTHSAHARCTQKGGSLPAHAARASAPLEGSGLPELRVRLLCRRATCAGVRA